MDLVKEQVLEIEKIVKKYGNAQTSLIPILREVKNQFQNLDADKLKIISKFMNLPEAEVYGVASFYTFLEPHQYGRFVIRICKNISCDMKNKNEIILAIEKKLGIKVGETTKDNKFTLLETNCLGHCNLGPAMLINNEIYTQLTPTKVIEIIESYNKK